MYKVYVSRWFSSPRTGCSREDSHTGLPHGSSIIAQICNCSETCAGVSVQLLCFCLKSLFYCSWSGDQEDWARVASLARDKGLATGWAEKTRKV